MELIVNNGKPVEPNKLAQVKAAMTKEPVIVSLGISTIYKIVADHLWATSSFLSKYPQGTGKFDKETNTLTFTFIKPEE